MVLSRSSQPLLVTSKSNYLCINPETEMDIGVSGRALGSEVGETFARHLTDGPWDQKNIPCILPWGQRKDCLTWGIFEESYWTEGLEIPFE